MGTAGPARRLAAPASLTYWHDLEDTVSYATGLGIHVTLAHYGKGGTTLGIQGFRGGSTANAARDRLTVMVDWARPLGLRVHVGEIGFSADAPGAAATWASFVQYCDANRDVVTGFDWWGASDPGWFTDTGAAHFSVSPTTAGPTIYEGDTHNMQMIQGAGVLSTPRGGVDR